MLRFVIAVSSSFAIQLLITENYDFSEEGNPARGQRGIPFRWIDGHYGTIRCRQELIVEYFSRIYVSITAIRVLYGDLNFRFMKCVQSYMHNYTHTISNFVYSHRCKPSSSLLYNEVRPRLYLWYREIGELNLHKFPIVVQIVYALGSRTISFYVIIFGYIGSEVPI